MYVMNVSDDYNDSLSLNNNCTIKENNIEITIPTLLLTKPCDLSLFCLTSLMIYTLIKPLLKFK